MVNVDHGASRGIWVSWGSSGFSALHGKPLCLWRPQTAWKLPLGTPVRVPEGQTPLSRTRAGHTQAHLVPAGYPSSPTPLFGFGLGLCSKPLDPLPPPHGKLSSGGGYDLIRSIKQPEVGSVRGGKGQAGLAGLAGAPLWDRTGQGRGGPVSSQQELPCPPASPALSLS